MTTAVAHNPALIWLSCSLFKLQDRPLQRTNPALNLCILYEPVPGFTDETHPLWFKPFSMSFKHDFITWILTSSVYMCGKTSLSWLLHMWLKGKSVYNEQKIVFQHTPLSVNSYTSCKIDKALKTWLFQLDTGRSSSQPPTKAYVTQ